MPEQRDTNKGFKATTIILIIAIILAVFVGVLLFFGTSGIFKAIFITIQILFFLGIIFLLGYLFYHLFLKKHKFDVNYVNKQKIIDAASRIKRPLLKDLYLSGDKGHSRALVGTITGYLRMQVVIRNYIYLDKIDPKTGQITKELATTLDERGQPKPQYTLEKKEQDVFVVKPKGLKGMFESPMVIRVDPDEHNDLVGDVDVYGYSIIPLGEYWVLNNDMLDVRKTDFAVLKEAERTIAYVTMTDMKEIVDKATGADAGHKKGIEKKSLVELPEFRNAGQTSQYE